MPQNSSTSRSVAWLVLALVLVGHIILFSASGVLGVQRFGTPFHYVYRQGMAAILGFILMIGISRIRYQHWQKFAPFLLWIQVALILATYVPGIKHQAQGASRWLKLGPVIFQPSELAKVLVIIYVARLLVNHKNLPLTAQQWILKLAPIGILLALILRQPDLGTTILITCITLGLFFLAGAHPLTIAACTTSGAILAVVAMLHSDYRRRRLLAFLNPWSDPQGSGFQTIQSFLSIHTGGLFGVGLGNGNSKLFYLPEVHTDFIFSLVAEELGFVGAVILLFLFLYLIYQLFRIAFQAQDPFGCYVAFGLALGLALQLCINLGGVTGLVPVKGLPLPFISWGRSALLVNLAMLGILLNIARQSAIIPSNNESS